MRLSSISRTIQEVSNKWGGKMQNKKGLLINWPVIVTDFNQKGIIKNKQICETE
jgi:hypothetical protein